MLLECIFFSLPYCDTSHLGTGHLLSGREISNWKIGPTQQKRSSQGKLFCGPSLCELPFPVACCRQGSSLSPREVFFKLIILEQYLKLNIAIVKTSRLNRLHKINKSGYINYTDINPSFHPRVYTDHLDSFYLPLALYQYCNVTFLCYRIMLQHCREVLSLLYNFFLQISL